MFQIGDVKEKGKAAFKRNYWPSVIVAVILYLLIGGFAAGSAGQGRSANEALTAQQEADFTAAAAALTQEQAEAIFAAIGAGVLLVSIISLVLKIFVFNPLQVGCYRFFKKNAEGEDAGVGIIKEGFGQYGHVFATLFLRDLFTILWGCLCCIPGIIKHYSYMMVPYILKDEPELSATEAITRSRQMMNGNKMQAFLLDLSFIGWFLLEGITCGLVGIFWTNPYLENTRAAMYLEIKDKAQNAV